MDEYGFNGYTFQWSRGLYLTVGEPSTINIYPGSNLEGVLCGLGGDSILDLHLELSGGGLITIDEERDDLPVLQFATGDEQIAYVVTVEARDLLFGAAADSAYVFYVLRPVTAVLEPNISAPVDPDSAITGE